LVKGRGGKICFVASDLIFRVKALSHSEVLILTVLSKIEAGRCKVSFSVNASKNRDSKLF